jgi:methyl-accepting chemotaxis protein
VSSLETMPPPTQTGRHQRQWRHLLLDRRFQLKYTAMIVGLATVICAVLGSFLIRKIRENSRMLELEMAGDPVFLEQLQTADAALVASIAGSFLFFLLVLGLLSLFITHRMAGPIYVMGRHVRALAKGRLPVVRALRKGDEFVELHASLTTAVDALHLRTEQEIRILARAVEVLGGQDAPEAAGARRELEDLLEEKRRMLQG